MWLVPLCAIGSDAIQQNKPVKALWLFWHPLQASFQTICNDLRAFARKRGTAAERIAYHMLLALEHRAAGTGLAFINKPLKRTIQVQAAYTSPSLRQAPLCCSKPRWHS